MPSYRYAGPYEVTYPESRDALNFPVGTVKPGDVRELSEPLDHMWAELTDEDRARMAAEEAERNATTETERLAAEAPAADGAGPESNPDGPEGKPDTSAA